MFKRLQKFHVTPSLDRQEIEAAKQGSLPRMSAIHYLSLVGAAQNARRLHIHRTHIPDTAAHPPYQHEHLSEEVFYILEGRAEYRFGGQAITAGPGETVFIPSGVRHAEITYFTPTMTYLTIRTVEPQDEPCCCGEDR